MRVCYKTAKHRSPENIHANIYQTQLHQAVTAQMSYSCPGVAYFYQPQAVANATKISISYKLTGWCQTTYDLGQPWGKKDLRADHEFFQRTYL